MGDDGNSCDKARIIKVKAGDVEVVEINKNNHEDIENALKDAQTKVLNGQKFEDKISVKVEKHDEEVPEVTLIDLPGVFLLRTLTEADELQDRVINMITDRVNNDMSLILHVVPLNQDTDTISTWRIVRDADKNQERTISVLTKADLTLKD